MLNSYGPFAEDVVNVILMAGGFRGCTRGQLLPVRSRHLSSQQTDGSPFKGPVTISGTCDIVFGVPRK